MNTTIIVDGTDRDSAANAIARVALKRGTCTTVLLADFLRENGVRFNDRTGYLCENTSAAVPNSDQTLVNRVVQISPETTASFDNGKGLVTPTMVLASYARVIERFPRVLGTCGRYSSVGDMLPLNLQWRLFASKIDTMLTPRFAFGFGADDVDIEDFREPVWKTPFDLYMWQKDDANTRPELHPFVVDKPAGIPVIGYFVGDAVDAFALHETDRMSASDKEHILLSMPLIKQMFGAFMGECLFFADRESIVFAAFSHYLKTSSLRGDFINTVDRGLA